MTIDEIRERLDLPPSARPKAPDVPKGKHFHIWAERGWSGILSPAYATLDHANGGLRALAHALGVEDIDLAVQGGSGHFAFTQTFLKVGRVSLNCVLKECSGGKIMYRDCNRSGEWV